MDRLLEATRQAEQVHFWFRGFRAFVRPLVEEAVAGISSPRILDCGCGTGANVVMLGEYGRAAGFDLTWRGLQFGHEYGLRQLVQASAGDIPFASGAFDLVTAFDVLQALPDGIERSAVREMYRLLRPGASLIVNVAALDVLRGSHATFGAEVRRYTSGRLRALLSEAGFEVRRLTYTNFTLFPLMLPVRLAQRVLGRASTEKAAVDISVPPAPVNALLSSAVLVEARALRHLNMPIGSSILCLARKPR